MFVCHPSNTMSPKYSFLHFFLAVTRPSLAFILILTQQIFLAVLSIAEVLFMQG